MSATIPDRRLSDVLRALRGGDRTRANWLAFLEALMGPALALLLLLLPVDDGTKVGRIVAGALLCTGGLALWYRRGMLPAPVRRFGWGCLALLGVLAVSAALSLDPGYSIKTWIEQALPQCLLFLAVLLWAWERDDRRLLAFRALAVSAALAGVVTVVGYYTGKLVYESRDSLGNVYFRATGPYQSYSRSAMYAVMVAPCVAAYAAVTWPGRRREAVAALAALAVLLWGLALTQTRAAWGACFLGLAVVAVQVKPRLLAVLAGVAILAGMASPSVRTRVLSQFRDFKHLDTILAERPGLWKVGLRAIEDRPVFGIGYGPNIFLQEPTKVDYHLFNHVQQPDLHQVYLQQAAESGVVGALAYGGVLAMLGLAVVRGRPWQRFPRLEEAHRGRLLTLGAAAGLTGILLYGIVGNFYEERNAMLFWLLAALAAAPPQVGSPKES